MGGAGLTERSGFLGVRRRKEESGGSAEPDIPQLQKVHSLLISLRFVNPNWGFSFGERQRAGVNAARQDEVPFRETIKSRTIK